MNRNFRVWWNLVLVTFIGCIGQPSPQVPDDVVLQLDLEQTFSSRFGASIVFGRIPLFTLYGDGTVIRCDRVTCEYPTRGAIEANQIDVFMREVMGQGLAFILERWPTNDETFRADYPWLHIKYRVGGKPKERTIYAGVVGEPRQKLAALRKFLSEVPIRGEQFFESEMTTLFLAKKPQPSSAAPWPLDESYVRGSDYKGMSAIPRTDVQRLFESSERRYGEHEFSFLGERVSVYLVPWLPDEDHEQALGEFDDLVDLDDEDLRQWLQRYRSRVTTKLVGEAVEQP
jgi:hypothetical protein